MVLSLFSLVNGLATIPSVSTVSLWRDINGAEQKKMVARVNAAGDPGR